MHSRFKDEANGKLGATKSNSFLQINTTLINSFMHIRHLTICSEAYSPSNLEDYRQSAAMIRRLYLRCVSLLATLCLGLPGGDSRGLLSARIYQLATQSAALSLREAGCSEGLQSIQ